MGFPCMSHTNVLKEYDVNDLELNTITLRFERERQLSHRDVLAMKVVGVVLPILTLIATIGFGYCAIVFVGAAALLNLAVFAAIIGGAFTWAIWGDLPKYELRLKKDLFEDLLEADQASMTAEKIELFQKYGAECQQLKIPNFLLEGYSGRHIRPGVPVRKFFAWAKEAVGAPEEGDSLNTIIRTIGMQKIIQDIHRGQDNYIKPWQSGRQPGTGLDAIAYKMFECTLQLNCLSYTDVFERTLQPNRFTSFQQKVKSLVDDAHGLVKSGNDTIVWSLEEVATIIKHCTNLKMLFLPDDFLCAELFQGNTNNGLLVRSTNSNSQHQNIVKNKLPNVQGIFQQKFLSDVSIQKESIRHDDGTAAHQDRLQRVALLFGGQAATPVLQD